VCPCRSYLFEQDLILFFALCLGSSSMPKVFCCPPPDFSCARDFHFLHDFLSALFHVPKLVLSQFLSSSLGASFSLRYGTNFWSNCWVCSSDLFFSPALCSSFLNPAVMVSVKLSALEISCLVFSIYVPAVHFLKRQDFAVSVLGSVQIFPVSFFLLAARTCVLQRATGGQFGFVFPASAQFLVLAPQSIAGSGRSPSVFLTHEAERASKGQLPRFACTVGLCSQESLCLSHPRFMLSSPVSV
jgi:hypothetical protein